VFSGVSFADFGSIENADTLSVRSLIA